MRCIRGVAAFVLVVAGGCLGGPYTDVSSGSESNCPVINNTSWDASNFRLRHSMPKRCPTSFRRSLGIPPVLPTRIERRPELTARVNHEAKVIPPPHSHR
jgi:hypothetical protein